MTALHYPLAQDAIGSIKAHDVTPAMWDGEQKRSPQGVPLWNVVISCDLGRFQVRVASASVPALAPGTPVHVTGLAIVGWGRSGPYFAAASIAVLDGKAQ